MSILNEVAAIHPEVFAYSLHASGLLPDRIGPTRLRDAAASARSTLTRVDPISEHPALAVWRSAYAAAGVKPSRFRSSVEALARRAVRDDVPEVLPLVDLYNEVSLSHLVPLGACDADRLSEAVELRLFRPETDRFQPLGARAEDFPALRSIPVYAAGDDVLCWCFNCRDAAPTALVEETTNAMFFTEGVAEWQRAAAERALGDLAARLRAAGAEVRVAAFARS